jgi:1-aminocyclopropane-1-carboxylate deaminase/D-cysteine desulfhydrase-like pyridoxal-dependent ACC family enzyme
LEPHLILRTSNPDNEPGFAGNLLLNRMVGAKIYTVSTSNYARFGSDALTSILESQLRAQGKNPFVIPVGGSDSLGCWGYLEAIRELSQQCIDLGLGQFDHLVFACGSGGTATGIALAIKLAGLRTKVHAVGVCDSPAYFYSHMRLVAEQIGVNFDAVGFPEEWCTVYPGQGLGYARSSDAELQYLYELSKKTGIILDPVYSGKALYYFSTEQNQAATFKPGDKIVFIHTGGVLGMYDKVSQLSSIVSSSEVQKLSLEQSKPNECGSS